MLRHVFVNLVSNAVKFTSSKPKAAIEIGGSAEGNDNFYCVRDNSSEEFEGTGGDEPSSNGSSSVTEDAFGQ